MMRDKEWLEVGQIDGRIYFGFAFSHVVLLWGQLGLFLQTVLGIFYEKYDFIDRAFKTGT